MVVTGRRFGKSRLGVNKALKWALRKAGALIWYIAPTYDDARDFAWEPLKAMTAGMARYCNETRLEIGLLNGSIIRLRSAERPDSLRGRGLDGVIFDEFRWIEPRTWTEVIRPALADKRGDALFLSTPKGFDWVYEMYKRGQDPDRRNWTSYTATSRDGGWISEEEMADVAADTDDRTFRQEYEASFETAEGRVYYTFDRKIHVDPSVVDTGAEIYIGQDFNVHPMAGCAAVKAGPEIHFIDSWELPISNTEELIEEMAVRFPERVLIFCPDPSGSARKTSAPIGQTDHTIIERGGYKILTPRKAPLIVDRYNNTNSNLLAKDGTVRVKIHPRAKQLIRGWEGLCYKEGTSLADKNQKDINGIQIQHICDAGDYLLWMVSNLVEPHRRTRQGEFAI